MKLVEFTNNPPAFEIVNADSHVVIRFYCDVQTVIRDSQGEASTGYVAECYELKTKPSANLESRIEKNFDLWLEKAKESDGSLKDLKDEKIKLSKSLLADYIASHPLTSTAHGGVAGIYSVTEEKQS